MDALQVRTVIRLYGVMSAVSGLALAGLAVIVWFVFDRFLAAKGAQIPGGTGWILAIGCGAGGFVVLLGLAVLTASGPLSRWIAGRGVS